MEIQYTKAHIADLERSIGELNEKRKVLTSRKINLEGELSTLKTHRNPRRVDRNLESSIDLVKKSLAHLNDEIIEINSQKSKKAILKQDIEKGLKSGMFTRSMPAEAEKIHMNEDYFNDFRLKVVNLKNKYQTFSADHTRISSKRQMAAEFAIELDEILKNKR